MAEFLLELLSEEIPARMQAPRGRRSAAAWSADKLARARARPSPGPRPMRRRAAWRLWIDGLAGAAARSRERDQGPARRRAGQRDRGLPQGARAREPRCLRAARHGHGASGSMSSAWPGRPDGRGAGRDPAARRSLGMPWPKSMRWAMTALTLGAAAAQHRRRLRRRAGALRGRARLARASAPHRLAQGDPRPPLPRAAELHGREFQRLQGAPRRAPRHARSGRAAPCHPQACRAPGRAPKASAVAPRRGAARRGGRASSNGRSC